MVKSETNMQIKHLNSCISQHTCHHYLRLFSISYVAFVFKVAASEFLKSISDKSFCFCCLYSASAGTLFPKTFNNALGVRSKVMI